MNTITYTKADIKRLANLYKLNGGSISKTLSVALGLDMFQEMEDRAVFITECVETISCVESGSPCHTSRDALIQFAKEAMRP